MPTASRIVLVTPVVILLCGVGNARAAECVQISSGGDTFSGQVISQDRNTIVIRDANTGTPTPWTLAGLDAPPARIACPGELPGSPPGEAPRLDGDRLLKLAGSATIGEKLAPALVEEFARQLGLTQGSAVTRPQALEQDVTIQGGSTSLRAVITFAGTSTAWPAMKGDKSVIGMASARVKAAISDDFAAAGLGALRDPGNEHVIGLDGIRVIVNRGNPLESVTLQDLRRIFSGEVTRWSDLDHSLAAGGPADSIVLYEPDSKSGTHKTFDELVMGGTAHSPSAKVDERPDVVAAAVERNPAAIAYVGYAYGSQDRSLPIAEPACGLVLPPTPFLIKAEEYPLARRLFLYTTTKAADLSMQFVQFAQGTRAQERAAKIGYVNLLAEEANDGYTSRRVASAPAGLAGRAQHQIRTAFEKAIVGAHRLSITFRFQLGSDSLDSRGQADVARLASAIKAEYPDRSVTLIGHSSTDGEFGQNVALSLKRAIDVADKLKDAHVRVARAIGVGPVSQVGCPVAGGSDAAENDINRRVEVWVR